jgi:hypothetical protein
VNKQIRLIKSFSDRDLIWGGVGDYWPAGAVYDIMNIANDAAEMGITAEEARWMVETGKAEYINVSRENT